MTATALQVESGITFAEFADKIVAERTKYIRGVDKEANRYGLHIRTACFAEMPLETIRPRHVGEWHEQMKGKRAQDRRGDRALSKHSIERCHALVSVVFGEAVRRDLIPSNPCIGMKLRMAVGEEDTKEKWAFFTLAEQDAIRDCAAIPDADRWTILFAIGTGLRQGEQFNLLLADLHVDGPEPFVYVRYGSRNKPPKSGRCRRVPLFGIALAAARRWLEILPSYAPHNPEQLAFPSRTGGRRSVGKPMGRSLKVDGKWIDPFKVYQRAAGITKDARWHDCRHACASALVMGMWGGRVWALPEIRDLLGHSSVTISERYSHLSETALKSAARETSEAMPAKVDVSAVLAKGPDQVRKYGWASGLFARVVRRIGRGAAKVAEEMSRVA